MANAVYSFGSSMTKNCVRLPHTADLYKLTSLKIQIYPLKLQVIWAYFALGLY